MIPVAVLIILFSLLTVSVNTGDFKQDGISYRLPNNTLPVRYDIEISTRIDEAVFNFFGKVKIRLQVVAQGRDVTLHAKQLAIGSVVLRNSEGILVAIQTPTVNPVTNFLNIVTVSEQLVVGQDYTLDIEYSGILRNDNLGFYRSSYVNEAGVTE
jgi:Peptidase M1 N-terminal domain